MASLNTSSDGASISRSYQSIVNAPPPSGRAASSQTYGQWAVFSVSAPLVSAFQQDGGKESVLKVQTTGEGELDELIEEFSDGKVQFAFVKVKDTNTALPKFVLIAWCGEGVPERVKGYFSGHTAAVSKILHGYHVQITARSDRDLTPESIIQKVAAASGSNYSNNPAVSSGSNAPPLPSSKPVFNPTRVGGGGFNALAGSRSQSGYSGNAGVDSDGWGADAPPVTRSELEKVPSAYQPTKVNMAELTKQPVHSSSSSRFEAVPSRESDEGDIIKGGYQPVGKVDIEAIRRQARESGQTGDSRPEPVKSAYEPVGKVDIAAIRSRVQPSTSPPGRLSPATTGISGRSGDSGDERTLADRSAAFTQSERLTSLPKPKVANRFSSGSGSFTGTKAPTPGSFGLGLGPKPAAPVPVGTASRTFADEGGKTPAQIWAEKKARQRGLSGAGEGQQPAAGGPISPIGAQKSGGWEPGYTGKKWAPISTNTTGRSRGSSVGHQGSDTQDDAPTSPAGGVGALRDRFKGAAPMGAPTIGRSPTGDRAPPSPPPLDMSSKPSASGPRGGVSIPGFPPRPQQQEDDYDEDHETHMPAPPPPQPPRSASPPTPPEMRSGSPIRIAQPVSRRFDEAQPEPPEERFSSQPVPTESIARVAPRESEISDMPSGHDSARGAAVSAAAAAIGAGAVGANVGHPEVAGRAPESHPTHGSGGKSATVQYDYEKAEDNEIALVEGQHVTDIDMVDEDWWMGTNSKGERGLFPANYVELIPEGQVTSGGAHEVAAPAPAPASSGGGKTATAIYDYEAAEDNELSFPDGAKVTDIEFPDDDWWFGKYGGREGLFPASYVELNK